MIHRITHGDLLHGSSPVWKNLLIFPISVEKYPKPKKERMWENDLSEGYRIIYLRQTDYVYIVAVTYGSRDLSGKDDKPWDAR